MPPPIRDLALLSDCQSAALVTRDGTVAWWPAPRFDSPSAFSALGLVNAAAALTEAEERQVAA